MTDNKGQKTEDARQLPIADRGEAVPALGPAGILPAVGNKGKMPSPHRQSQIENEERYPLRAPGEDPRWAVRIVWTWVSVALLLLLFLVTLIVLGFWYD